MMRTTTVHRIGMDSPDDVSGIRRLINQVKVDPSDIIAILGKTEGNGCVNDFTRGYATQSLRNLLAESLDEIQIMRIPLVMSGGTEGGLSPHWVILCVSAYNGDGNVESKAPALAVGSVITRDLSPTEIGRRTQVNIVEQGVLKAMQLADIQRPEDVHFIQIKCPLLTSDSIAAVDGDVATVDTLKSMGLSRGASALGVAMALGEIEGVEDAQIGTDLSLWSARASCSAGIELMGCEVVVLGQSPSWSGPLRVSHAVMQDAIDAASLNSLLSHATEERAHAVSSPEIVATLAKAEASSTGSIRGRRHTMLNDSDIASTRHARAFVGGLIAGIIGNTEIFVSGGAEHQGPDGGGPVAIIYSVGTI